MVSLYGCVWGGLGVEGEGRGGMGRGGGWGRVGRFWKGRPVNEAEVNKQKQISTIFAIKKFWAYIASFGSSCGVSNSTKIDDLPAMAHCIQIEIGVAANVFLALASSFMVWTNPWVIFEHPRMTASSASSAFFVFMFFSFFLHLDRSKNYQSRQPALFGNVLICSLDLLSHFLPNRSTHYWVWESDAARDRWDLLARTWYRPQGRFYYDCT